MNRFAMLLVPLLAACFPGSDDPPEAYSDCSSADGDDYQIGTPDGEGEPVRIEGDTLYVWVGHGGGCEAHAYQICWPGQIINTSIPAQVGLDIWHDANGDTCEAYLTEELEFDLTPLKHMYQEAAPGPGVLEIHLGSETVAYTFEG